MLKHNLQRLVVPNQLADGLPNVEPLLGASAGGGAETTSQFAVFRAIRASRRPMLSASSGGTSRAASASGGKISRVPPTSVATTATPEAAASSNTRPSGSCRAVCTNNVNSFNSDGMSSRRPRK